MMEIKMKKPQIAIEAEKGKRRTLGAEIGIFILVFFIGSLVAGIIPAVYDMVAMLNDEDTLNKIEEAILNPNGAFSGMMDIVMDMTDGMYIITLFCTFIVILTAILYCTKIEKRSLYSMGITREHAGTHYGIGLAFGLVLFSLCVGIAALLGGIRFEGLRENINPFIVILYLVGFGIQGFSEEIMFRGYFMVSIMKKSSVTKAIFINSLAFAIAHMLNPGLTVVAFINLMLIGVLMSVYVMKTNNIWGAAAFHSMWNFAQGILYGISVSGTDAKSAVLLTESTGAKIINGGLFGLEASIVTTIVVAAALGMLLYMKPNREETV
ncbi:MAG: CPBP family intramembrane metalloprotease [Coprococcus sp.]|nr:CPBP family intramembrane metalloprotease [Coprococcus sp.]